MIDLALLVEIVGTTALVVLPAIALNRLLADPDGPGLAELFRIPADQPRARGIQEEEPVRWRVEVLHRRCVERTREDRALAGRVAARDPGVGA